LDRQQPALDVLPSDANDVAATLSSVQQERQRKPLLRANRVVRLKGGDLILGPGVDAIALHARELDIPRWVLPHPFSLDRELAERADGLEPIARGVRRHLIEHGLDEPRRQQSERLVAVRIAEAFEDCTALGLRPLGLGTEELLRVVVFSN